MIRLFLTLCKCFQQSKKKDDYQINQLYAKNASEQTLSCACPACRAKGNFRGYDSYTRPLVCCTMGEIKEHSIRVTRVECRSCGHAHALLSPVVLPRSPFSFHFVISLLYDYVTKAHGTIEALCEAYGVGVSTLYRIFHRFLEDKKLMLGLMEDSLVSGRVFLDGFLQSAMTNVDERLRAFFEAQGRSFLQGSAPCG